MSNAGIFTDNAPGTVDIVTLTGDSGGAVPPDGAGNLDILGGNGINVVGTPGSNLLTASNLRDVARYVVAPTAGQAEYTSIQTAINQAVSDGASSSAPALVWIWAGIYTEDLTLAPFVYLGSGADGQSVTIIGNATFTTASNGDLFSASDIVFQTPGGGGAALTLAGTHTSEVSLANLQIAATTGTGLVINNANMEAYIFSCHFHASSGFKAIGVTDSDIVHFFNAHTESVNTASTFAGTGATTFFSSFLTDSFVLSGTCTVGLNGCDMVSLGTQSGITIGAGCFGIINNFLILSAAATGYWATGAGTISYSAVSPSLGTALLVNATLTTVPQTLQTGNMSFDGGANTLDTDGQLWIGDTGSNPVTATLTAGTNISITNGAGSITIDANSTSQIANYTAVNNAATPYTVLSADYYIGCDVTGGVISVLLPDSPSTGRVFVVKDVVGDSSTSNISVTSVSGVVTIDGATTYTMNLDYQSIQLIWNGATYEVF